MSLTPFPESGTANFESTARSAYNNWLIEIAAKAAATHIHNGGDPSIFKIVANKGSLGIGDQDGSMAVIIDTRAFVVWDAVNEQWTAAIDQWVPIEWGRDGANPPDSVEDITVSNQTIAVRTFEASADEDISFPLRVPLGVQTTKIRFKVHAVVTAATGPSSEGFAFALKGHSMGSGDAIGGAYGSAVVITIANETYAQHDIVITDWSNQITIANLAEGEMTMFNLYRDVGDGADDYGQVIGIMGIDILWQ